MKNKTIYQKSKPGRKGFSFNTEEIEGHDITDYVSEELCRQQSLCLPEVSELDVVRHYTSLSQLNFSIDTNFYPLGSCTMKYNPRVNEELASLEGFKKTHPMQYQYTVQGNLHLMYELGNLLKEITGLNAVTLQPAAGAHGELTGLLMIRACLTERGDARKKVIIPDSAHGTNPSSAHLCGYDVVTVKTNKEGCLDLEAIRDVMDEDVACLMVTNPSTLGVFEKNIKEITEYIHNKGGFVYCDGANLNAILGQVHMSELGVDCMHINLHKTFSTPHGGGGPGAGPIVVTKDLEPFLPVPVIEMSERGRYTALFNRPKSIGRIRAFFGNFSVLIRAYCYIREMGAGGLKQVSEMAVLNANYIRARLKDYYELACLSPSLHEVVFSDKSFKDTGIKTLDVAKRLLDLDMHAPTIYFPIIVSGAIMIEPTETESKENIDVFCDALIHILREAKEDPQILKESPLFTYCRRFDEVKAVREPCLREPLKSYEK